MSFAALTEDDRKGLQTLNAEKNGYSCPSGAYCSPQAGTNVSGSKTPIFHRTTTSLTRDSSNKITESKTEVYILSDGKWVLAATTKDGGKTYTFNEGTRSDGSKIVGAGLRQSFAPGGNMNKNVTKQTKETLKKGGSDLVPEKKLNPKELKDAGYPEAQPSETGDNTNPYNPEESIKAAGTDDRTRNDFNQLGHLVYPNDLGKTKQDIIQFDMLQYKPKKFASGQGQFGFIRDDKNRTSIGTVVLPIPSGISDTTGVTWGEDRLNAAEAELAKIALGTITKGGEGLKTSISQTIETVTANTGALQTAGAAAFAESAVGVRGLLTRTSGAVINPNLELLFNSPTLRPFNFRFKMSARNATEAQTIINIIRFFRQGMAPQRTPSNIFLKSPHIFKITYKNRSQGGEHKYIGKIKECALQNFTVDYTPEGQYATFYDGVMVSYEINMQFTELEPVFNEDNDKNYGEIGY